MEQQLEEILKSVEAQIEMPMETERFIDDWRECVKLEFDRGSAQFSLDDIIDIAWYQGRKAILLERMLRLLHEE